MEFKIEKYTCAPAFAHTLGPKSGAKLAIVGEAWGTTEEQIKLPFMGFSGQELTRCLQEAEIKRGDCFLTNALQLRPTDGKIESLCVSKKEVGKDYTLAPVTNGKYLHPALLAEFARLKEELEHVKPNLVLALGRLATLALLGTPKITAIRGAIAESTLVPGLKVLPSFHPSMILKNWANRPILLADLLKAQREQNLPEIRRPARKILISPTIEEVEELTQQILFYPPKILSCDIETRKKTITMLSFAWDWDKAVVIPFWDAAKPNGSYWPDLETELRAWRCVCTLLYHPMTKLFQNGLYDIQYFACMGFFVRNCTADTMLLHHTLYPEMQKGLGFLGSVYTDEASWKLMRDKPEEAKRDE